MAVDTGHTVFGIPVVESENLIIDNPFGNIRWGGWFTVTLLAEMDNELWHVTLTVMAFSRLDAAVEVLDKFSWSNAARVIVGEVELLQFAEE